MKNKYKDYRRNKQGIAINKNGAIIRGSIGDATHLKHIKSRKIGRKVVSILTDKESIKIVKKLNKAFIAVMIDDAITFNMRYKKRKSKTRK